MPDTYLFYWGKSTNLVREIYLEVRDLFVIIIVGTLTKIGTDVFSLEVPRRNLGMELFGWRKFTVNWLKWRQAETGGHINIDKRKINYSSATKLERSSNSIKYYHPFSNARDLYIKKVSSFISFLYFPRLQVRLTLSKPVTQTRAPDFNSQHSTLN